MNNKIKIIRGKEILTEDSAKSIAIHWIYNEGKKGGLSGYSYQTTVLRPSKNLLTYILLEGDKIAWEDGSIIVDFEKHGKVIVFADDRDLSVRCTGATEAIFKTRHTDNDKKDKSTPLSSIEKVKQGPQK